MSFELDYDEMVLLDAEALAEGGIGAAYELVLTSLQKFVAKPTAVREVVNNDLPSYSVKCGDKEFLIYSPDLDDSGCQAWGRATFALFMIVNDQLIHSDYRFFAINGGNDLGGLFLTTEQAEASWKTLRSKSDWPYLPSDGEPWYGQFH